MNHMYFLNTIIYYNYVAFCILILVALSIYLRKLNRTNSSRVFLVLISVCALAVIFEIGSVNWTEVYKQLDLQRFDPNNVVSYIFYIFNNTLKNSIIFIYLIYILIYTKNIKGFYKSIINKILLLIPYVFIMTLIYITPFTGLIFKLSINDGNLIYTQGVLFLAIYIIDAYYCIFILYYLLKSYKTFNKTQFISLISIVIAVIAGIVFRIIIPNIIVQMFAITLALIVIVFNVESPDLLIDEKTGLNSIRQFNMVIRTDFIYKRNTNLLLINISNYSDIFNKLGYENGDNYFIHLSHVISNNYTDNAIYETYYLNDGLFVIKFNDSIGIRDLCERIYNDISNLKYENIYFKLDAGLCLINIPNDIKNYEDFMIFVDNYHDNLISGVTIYSDIKNDKEYLIRYNIESILEDAIQYQRFKVYYQPIYNVELEYFNAAEALSRIDDPTFGIIYPNSFIHYAELNGYISKIDLGVIEEVMKFITNNDLNEYHLEKITINLSIADFNNFDFVDKVIQLKDLYKINPSYILFEVNEDETLGDKDYFYKKMNELKKEGFEFILDNYGIGYSNLEKFAKSSIEYVKIDREFVKISKNKNMREILPNIFKMIHDLKRKSFIEGIETKEDYDKFIKYNPNYVQGFYFSDALDYDKFIEFIKQK